MKRFVLPLAVVLCFLCLVSQHSTASAKDTWVSVRTENFFMVGNANEKEIRKVALRLEQFREAFTQLFPGARFNTPVPTTVVVFKSKSNYESFGPPNTGGFFQAGPDVNYIALSTESYYGMDRVFNIIFHEYIHLLVSNTLKNTPLWFNEGLAEYYSTFKISEDQKFELGLEPGSHLYFLSRNKMLPLRTLFAVDHKSPYYNERSKQNIFYAQSWALMHYLIIGKKLDQKLSGFLDLTAANVPVETAFPKIFETTFEAMEKELRDYVRQDRYGILKGQFAAKIELETNAEAKPLTEAEAQAYLGDLLLHTNRADAVTYLEKALKLDPNLGMAHASLGMLRFREGKADDARASLERAVAANSQNYLAHYYYAYTLSRVRPGETVTAYTPEQTAKIREHLQRAIALRPDFPEAYSLLAFVSLITGEGLDAAIASMKQVIKTSPGRSDFVFMLAQLHMRDRDYKTARPLLEQLATSNAEEQLRQRASQMLAQIDSYEKQLTAFNEAEKSAVGRGGNNPLVVSPDSETPARSATSAPSSASTTSSDPSSSLREVLRTPAAGETQLQATLIKIECDAKGIVFVLQTPTGLLRLSTRNFEEIDLTTYSPDVKGEIGCGPRKTENVVVGYVPGVDKRTRSDGVLKSIEFVPADFKLK